MKIRPIPILIISTFAGILTLVIYLYVHLGGYKDVAFARGDYGPLHVVFHHHVGPYHKIIESIEKVETWAKASGVSCDLSFGEFLDDPGSVAEDRLQSNGGCIVAAEPTGLPADLAYRLIEKRSYLIAEFSGAPSIGPFKVYPKAQSWMRDHRARQTGANLEIYKILSPESVQTTYLFPLAGTAQ